METPNCHNIAVIILLQYAIASPWTYYVYLVLMCKNHYISIYISITEDCRILYNFCLKSSTWDSSGPVFMTIFCNIIYHYLVCVVVLNYYSKLSLSTHLPQTPTRLFHMFHLCTIYQPQYVCYIWYMLCFFVTLWRSIYYWWITVPVVECLRSLIRIPL